MSFASKFRELVRTPSRDASSDAPVHIPENFYQLAYERHAVEHGDDSVIGGGDFEIVGRLELSALKLAGMQPNHSLLDLGCGIGRLAIHAAPFLTEGRYFGIEIAENILARARKRVAETGVAQQRITWLVESNGEFAALPDNSIDIGCAFSVFTHLEAEDTFRYLSGLRRIVRPQGKFVFSHLLLEENPQAQQTFRDSSGLTFAQRHSKVLNIVSSRTLLDSIATMAGWRVTHWFRHDEPAFENLPELARMGLGQAVCFLERP